MITKKLEFLASKVCTGEPMAQLTMHYDNDEFSIWLLVKKYFMNKVSLPAKAILG